MPLTVFIFGLLAASCALVLELVVLNLSHLHDYSSLAFDFSNLGILVVAALIEEGSKYLFAQKYLSRFFKDVTLTIPQVCIVGLFFGAGFAAIEVAFALSGNPAQSDLLRILATALLHILTSLIIIFFLRNEAGRSLGRFFLPLGLAFTLHMLYNVTLSLSLW